MAETIPALMCIGCGRLEAPQPCMGVCEDREVHLVDATEYAALEASYQALEAKYDAQQALLRQMARTRPHPNGWEAAFKMFQARAREAIQKHRR